MRRGGSERKHREKGRQVMERTQNKELRSEKETEKRGNKERIKDKKERTQEE